MVLKEILLYPDPRLKQVCQDVTGFDPELAEQLRDLADTLDASPFCVGIAAPQIGYLQRVILIDVSRNRKPVPNLGRHFMINPQLLSSSGAVVGREGCLSLPSLTANVTRAEEIQVQFLDRHGNRQAFASSGFEARVILHEMDHLDGLLFLDRVSSLKTDVFRRKRY
jgi:peptide deformylase